MKTSLIAVMSAAIIGGTAVAAHAQDAAKIEAGKAAYATAKCSMCHAIKGEGSKAASALDGVGTRLSVADLKKWLTATAEMEAKLKTKPKMSMAAVMKGKALKDADVDAITAYMASLK
jgi:mono/diheme cytochrome c family protein